MTKIPNVLNFDKEYESARQPRVGFAIPKATPPTRAAHSTQTFINKYRVLTHEMQFSMITLLNINIPKIES